jgi:hypothetical protein
MYAARNMLVTGKGEVCVKFCRRKTDIYQCSKYRHFSKYQRDMDATSAFGHVASLGLVEPVVRPTEWLEK